MSNQKTPRVRDSGYALLLNLALRLRMARRQVWRAARGKYPVNMQEYYKGAQLEAWNSFQAAKAVYAQCHGRVVG